MYKITCSNCGQLLGAMLRKPPVKMRLACRCGNTGTIQNTKSTNHFVLTGDSARIKSTQKSNAQKRSAGPTGKSNR